jgi:mannose/cellobiose epimerase-like protein (N-acyl-D-glucosamine 2-epimerase family)
MSESSPGFRENDTNIRTGLPLSVADEALRETAAQARRWLFEEALPLWGRVGRDETHGGFFEQIDFDNVEPICLPKRCRVQARQIYSFCEAGRLGWEGPWRDCAQSGLDFMLRSHRREDGLMRFKAAREGAPFDDSVDNYDQAFAIFGLAHAQALDAEAASLAQNLLAALRRDRAHPLGGFEERTAGPAPLLANPHMHFFEAALAWLDVAPLPVWRDLADEIARLCQNRFIDPRSGALREYFEADWTPCAGDMGRIVEPGHQFEWAWLLLRWHGHGGDVDLAVPRRLYEFAARHGLDPRQSLTISETLDDGTVRDAGARLWPQAERLKAAIAFGRLYPEERARFEADAKDAWRGLQIFLDEKTPGLFRDKRATDGSFAAEGALASSLYHIVGGVSELVRYAGQDVSA